MSKNAKIQRLIYIVVRVTCYRPSVTLTGYGILCVLAWLMEKLGWDTATEHRVCQVRIMSTISHTNRWIGIAVIAVVVITGLYQARTILGSGGNQTTGQSTPTDRTAQNEFTLPQSPISLTFAVSKPPALGQEATLILTISSSELATRTLITIDVPSGLVIVQGQQSWYEDLAPRQTIIRSVRIKAVQAGVWRVEAKAWHKDSAYYEFGDTKRLFLTVSAGMGSASNAPPISPKDRQTIETRQ